MKKLLEFGRPEIATVGMKGQIVIPQDIRKSIHLEPGSLVRVVHMGHIITLKPLGKSITKEEIEDLKAVEEAWKDIEGGRFETFSPDNFFKRQRKWLKLKK